MSSVRRAWRGKCNTCGCGSDPSAATLTRYYTFTWQYRSFFCWHNRCRVSRLVCVVWGQLDRECAGNVVLVVPQVYQAPGFRD
jgi:hypothetical protein